ncbi:delta(3,5)-Delta(2,4)-dienoyl-CoA isomerase, mitochondrial isoform X2 [Strigops habroptila]|uniref:Delta(3,5)-Delta(2,4)-dienoyl-CoA isomerase, mitochondrial n=1 Tax=Strigops habroptila TaxID=2489341 RepID=A0A672V340_STRHB|nr:delta(3,5)-Delta(2,4)-dienoyl-CoA isomerase, mitochondrial isoform X2 [Strigops habroptila]
MAAAPLRLLRGTLLGGLRGPQRLMATEAGAPEQLRRGFETLRVTREREHVLHVQLHRPDKRNAMNRAFWREMVECFQAIAHDSSCRAVVVSGAGKVFSAGLDLADVGSELLMVEGDDPARKAWNLRKKICAFQESFSVLEKCLKPVIVAVHGACIGAGVDLICACDIRYCSQDAWFQVKEVDIGLAADVGTLQRLPKIVGSQSLVNELAFTARKMMAPEAQSCGLVSRVFPDKESLLQAAVAVAEAIAARSPVAVQGSKENLLYARDHPVSESLRYMAAWNMGMLQTQDVPAAVQAAMDRKGTEGALFSNL